MTSQRLFGILKKIDTIERSLGTQSALEHVRDALSNLVNQPAQPSLQSNLASAINSFADAAAKMGQSIAPSEAAAIQQMGGSECFDPEIAEKVTHSIQTNAMTPSVARDYVQNLAAKRSRFLATVRAALKSLEELGISDSDLLPGTADVAFLVPRQIFDNELGRFARELTFINRLLQHFTEARTGKAEPVALEQLSSSIPTVTLRADLGVLSLLGTVINKFLDAWGKVEKIRRLRTEMAEVGLKGKALQELDDRITTTVDEVIEESVELVISNYNGDRKNELANGIRADTKRLFGQIERGLTVEFRAEPKTDGDAPDSDALREIANVAKELKFPPVAEAPLLLGSGEVLDNGEGGDIQVIRRTKKTTRRRTTTTAKGPHEENEHE